jgi:hypothetical protein
MLVFVREERTHKFFEKQLPGIHSILVIDAIIIMDDSIIRQYYENSEKIIEAK